MTTEEIVAKMALLLKEVTERNYRMVQEMVNMEKQIKGLLDHLQFQEQRIQALETSVVFLDRRTDPHNREP